MLQMRAKKHNAFNSEQIHIWYQQGSRQLIPVRQTQYLYYCYKPQYFNEIFFQSSFSHAA